VTSLASGSAAPGDRPVYEVAVAQHHQDGQAGQLASERAAGARAPRPGPGSPGCSA
jgi:hypothetical protein